VSHYSVSIARVLGLEGELIRQIELGGHLHDIGKIGVRESVLNKAGPLTPEEYAHVMTHPMLGWRVLSPLLADAPHALSIVRSHHERFDGLGRPDGLAGKAIPLEARVVAAADALDAMTSYRPYRAGEMSLEEAAREIRRHAGTQFDPAVIEALTAASDQGDLQLIAPAQRTLVPTPV
jgi:HD-GYP domain-containing protein (c-di-GMP phosphodiesterase class II)